MNTPPAPRRATRLVASEQKIEIEVKGNDAKPPIAAIGDVAEQSHAEQKLAATPSGALARATVADQPTRSAAQAPAQPAASVNAEVAPDVTPADSQRAVAAMPPAKAIDLGLNGGLVRLLSSQAPASTAAPPVMRRAERDTGAELTRRLNAGVLADDLARGSAHGNILLGPLNSAIRSVGPTRGEALIRITVDSQGELSGLELLRGEASDWAAVIQSFRQLAKTKRVRLPAGARGLRVTFNVSAKVQRTSGKEVEAPAIGVDRPSLAPNGMTFRGGFDAADIANKTNRMVYARIVAEEML